jgi:hypothetical protein
MSNSLSMKTRFLLLAVLASSVSTLLAAEPDQGLVAHEWGTFTSVQGADGLQMDWNPLVAPDLPKFVYDRVRPRVRKSIPGVIVAGKVGTSARQRMETPVIYFYSDQARTIDVEVKFPEGQVTEWYPQDTVADTNIPGAVSRGLKNMKPALLWKGIEVLPLMDSAKIELPFDPSGSHYYAARGTEAAMLRVPVGEKKTETEKFLFYRGIAHFQAPLTVKPDAADGKSLTLTNNSSEEIRHLFIYEVRDYGGVWMATDALKPGETRRVSLAAASGVQPMTAADRSLDKAMMISSPRLNSSLYHALIGEGLYPLEASAMVKTWESSWFSEKGLRVLYTLPRAWTDRTLPLNVTPAPKSIERVMVARAEVITPEMEKKVLGQIERYIPADAEARAKIVAETRELGLGRFLWPAMTRALSGSSRAQEFIQNAWQLYRAADIEPQASTAKSAAN